MSTTSVTQIETTSPTLSRSARPSRVLSAVVGFDGSDSSKAALAAATELIQGRNGHLEVVYVAHLSAGASISAPAVVGMRQGFDEIARELTEMTRAALDDREPRWHFQRRDGSVGNELVGAARELRRRHGPDATVMIVVGSSQHLIHHVVGSVAVALTHEAEFPLLVVPARPSAQPTSGGDRNG